MDEVLMEPANMIWQTPTTIPTTNNRNDRKYYISAKGMELLFSHPPPNSVMDIANQRGKQTNYKTTLQDKDWKRLDLQGRKVYSSSPLLMRASHYSALLSNYDHSIYEKLSQFINDIPENKREQFKSLLTKG